MPPALWGLPAITSLILSDVGLGQRQLVLAPVGYAPGLYPLPTGTRACVCHCVLWGPLPVHVILSSLTAI